MTTSKRRIYKAVVYFTFNELHLQDRQSKMEKINKIIQIYKGNERKILSYSRKYAFSHFFAASMLLKIWNLGYFTVC